MTAAIDLLGAFLTLVTFGALALGGYLGASLLLGEEARRDRLALAIVTILMAMALAIGIALLLGGLHALRFPLAFALLAGTVFWLLALARRTPDPWRPAVEAWAACRERLRADAALAVLTITAGGAELLRGLLRPPLSWDGLMYHVRLAADWLLSGNLLPVLAPLPGAYYGYVPANGSLWLWWWMAPSHGEFYLNLASAPHWLLLGLAAGGVARELGARRSWPAASFLVLMLPTVSRFVAAQYVDLLAGGTLVAASFFGLRWLRENRRADAVLAGCALGLAAGTKVIAAPAALALGAVLVWMGRRALRGRLHHAVLAVALLVLFGGFFYARNAALGASPLASECVAGSPAQRAGATETVAFPRPGSLLDRPSRFFEHGLGLDVLLGITVPASLEMGAGPVAVPLLVLLAALPFWALRRGRPERRFVAAQIGVSVLLWIGIPDWLGNDMHANLRYLVPALAWLGAAGIALAEERALPELWLRLAVLAIAAQSLLQQHAEMSRGVRLVFAASLLAACCLGLSAALRRWILLRRRGLALAAVAAALLAAPAWAAFRGLDRARAFAAEFTVHDTPARANAGAWEWLDANAGTRPVAVIGAYPSLFVYPAMGPRLERWAGYVNVDRENHRFAHQYAKCQARALPDREAWLVNLRRAEIGFLHVGRLPGQDFPIEDTWAGQVPSALALRYEDALNRVYEIRGDPAREGRENH